MSKRGAKTGSSLPLVQKEGERDEVKKYGIGARVVCSDEDAETLRAAAAPLAELHQRLGALREEFLAREQQLLRSISQARENYLNTAITIGRKKGIDLGPGSSETWTFKPEESAFVRTA